MEPDYIKLGAIATNPNNPREDFSDESLGESIEKLSMLDPIDVRPVSEKDQFPKEILYVVCDGDRRLETLKDLHSGDFRLTIGKEVLIHDLTPDEAFDFNIIKNMQRKNYNLREECNIVQHYNEQGLSQIEIANKCNRSRGWVQIRLHILKQDQSTQAKYFTGQLNVRDIVTKQSANVGTSEGVSATPLLDKYRPENDVAPEDGAMQSITKPPKFLCPTEFFEYLKELLPGDIEFTDIKMVGVYTGFNIKTEDEEADKVIIEKIQEFHEEAKKNIEFEKSKASEEERKTIFTKDQFEAIELDPEFEDKMHNYQIIGEDFPIIWKSFKSKMDAIKWLLDHKADFPLTRWQLEKYTDLSQDEIQKLVEDSIQQEAEERVKVKPEGPVKNAFAFVTKQEYDSLLPSIKALITAKEPVPEAEQRNGRNMQLFFSSWEDESTMSRWLKPSKDHVEAILQFPASTFMSTNLKDILIDDKQLKKHFPNVYQELKQLQNFCKNLKSISLRSMEEITKVAKRLEVFMREVDLDLQHLKKTRRISGSEEQHLRICQQCLQPKWMIPKKDLCGNCITTNNKQDKKTAAASSSGGQQ